MEIKNVVKEVQNEYPKIEQINKKNIEKNIPNKWRKIGISTFITTLIIKNKVFASTKYNIERDVTVEGAMPLKIAEPVVAYTDIICMIIQTISVATFVGAIISILIEKRKEKKQQEEKGKGNKKLKKKNKKILLISVILFILCFVIKIIVHKVKKV